MLILLLSQISDANDDRAFEKAVDTATSLIKVSGCERHSFRLINKKDLVEGLTKFVVLERFRGPLQQ